MNDNFARALSITRIIPALRGITAAEVPSVAETLLEFGVTVLEVPLRTKDPAFSSIEDDALKSLEKLVENYASSATIVAGTVTNDRDLDVLQNIGVTNCFSLNLQPELIEHAVRCGMNFVPGVETVTEAIAATRAGAVGLKLFPAVVREPDGQTSVRLTPGFVSYLCRFMSVPIIPAGNAFDNGIAGAYLRAGAIALNIGAQLYQPGVSMESLRNRLVALISQFEET